VALFLLVMTLLVMWSALVSLRPVPELFAPRLALLMALALYSGLAVQPIINLAGASFAAYVRLGHRYNKLS